MPQVASREEGYELWLDTQYSPRPDWNYGQWIVKIIEDRFSSIETILGVTNTAGPFLKMLENAMSHLDISISDMTNWREALQYVRHPAYTTWDTSMKIDELGCYGLFGTIGSELPVAERAAYIERLLGEVEEFVASSDLERIAGKTNQITKILNLAKARWNIDQQQGDVDPASLAILGGLSEGRIRNMMSGKTPEFENIGGRIAAASALAWLQKRSDHFYKSIWNREETDVTEEADEADGSIKERITDVVFVPMAQDRSIFHPGLARAGRFQIGPKGAEFHCDSFEEALQALQHMPMPYWRRPNAGGLWGLVKAAQWVRIEGADLHRGVVTA